MTQLFLTGYEKETVDEFLKKLQKAGVRTVIDVREIPLSRKNSFSKNNLKEILEKKGISYFHFSQLGSPTKVREELRDTGDYLHFFKEYRKYAHRHLSSIRNALEIIKSKNYSAILCFERDYNLCHRTILASEMLKMYPRIQIIPL